MPPSERDRLIEAMVERYRAVLEQRVPRSPQTLDEIEQTVEEISVKMERELERRVLEQQENLPDWPDNQVRCACGAMARFRERRPRLLVTRHGEGFLQRRYYYCAACRSGFAPLDQQLGLDRGATTTQVRVWVATLGAYLPFAQAAIVLEQLTGVRLGPSTLERVTVAVGTSVQRAQRQRSQQHRQGTLAQPARKPPRLYIGMDGKIVPLRDPWKRDGSAGALACRGAECKAGVVYQALAGPKGDRGVGRRAYVATLEKAALFGQQLATVAHEQGVHWASEVVVLGDGAAWIWQIAASQFPEAIQIVDFFHASEHLWEVARAWFGPESEAAKAWVKARQEELHQDDAAAVLTAIRAWKPRRAEWRKLRQETLHYVASNQERMRYGTFRRLGYHIGSGVVEATCKHVVGSRLDAAGMHWREASAEAVVSLRAALLSTDSLDLHPHCAHAH